MKQLQILIIVLFGLIGLFLANMLTIESLSEKGGEVDCFDRYGNKILGEVCYEEPPSTDDKINSYLMGFILFIIILMVGFVASMLLDIPWSYS
jgi:hypothetical protein